MLKINTIKHRLERFYYVYRELIIFPPLNVGSSSFFPELLLQLGRKAGITSANITEGIMIDYLVILPKILSSVEC